MTVFTRDPRFARESRILSRRNVLAALSFLALLFVLYHRDRFELLPAKARHAYQPQTYTRSLVVSSIRAEDTSWIAKELPNLETYVYVADDPSAPYHPPANKGHEAISYLTHIIDHYHNNLTDITIFTHAHRHGWHNNHIFDDDMAAMIRFLNPAHVMELGFFNLRCHPESGCPKHLDPHNTEFNYWKQEEMHVARAWRELYGAETPLPDSISAICCSQFALSRDRIRSVPLERWTHYRDWLLTTDLEDSISGRIMEFQWHYILTGNPVNCPRMDVCYCQGYGVCFGSLERVEGWLALRTMGEMQEDQLTLFQDKWDDETRGRLEWRLDKGMREPLTVRLQEAMLRGEEIARIGERAVGAWRDDRGF